jgi:hypothetical protein
MITYNITVIFLYKYNYITLESTIKINQLS